MSDLPLPYTTKAEFEAWVEKERLRFELEADAEAIRIIREERLLARVVWEAEPATLDGRFGVRLTVDGESGWFQQMCSLIGRDRRLTLPVSDGHATMLEHDARVHLTFEREIFQQMLTEYDLRVSVASADKELETKKRALERAQALRDTFVADLGDHFVPA